MSTNNVTPAPAPEFEMRSDGLYWNPKREAGAAFRLCCPVRKLSDARDANSENWQVVLSWHDPAGVAHVEPVARVDLSRAGGSYVLDLLAHGGVDVPALPQARMALVRYLVETRALNPGLERISEIVGWCGAAFVTQAHIYTPHASTSQRGETIRFVGKVADACVQQGHLEAWQENVARLAVGNPLAVFAISIAFAAPLMKSVQLDNAGFHFVGETSTGKSTLLHLCASVFGEPRSYIRQWATTHAALESLCQAANDLPLILDEIGQIDPRDAGRAAYLIANGTARNRGQANGGLRKQQGWRTALVSAGEKNLAQVMAEAGQAIKGGQAARLADIPADAGCGMGIIEELHGFDSSRQLVDHLRNACAECHGSAGAAYLDSLATQGVMDALSAALPKEVMEYVAALDVPNDAAPEIGRVAKAFALVGAAGHIATQLDITGWAPDTAMGAARACFASWLSYRGGAQAHDRAQLFERVRNWLQANAGTRLPPTTAQKHTLPPTRDLAGFTMYDGQHGVKAFLIYPGIFDRECLAEAGDKDLAKEILVAAGWLKRDKEQFARKERIAALDNRSTVRMIRLTPLAFGAESEYPDGDDPDVQPFIPPEVRRGSIAEEFDR